MAQKLRIVVPGDDRLEEILSVNDEGNGNNSDKAAEQAFLEALSESDIDTLSRVSYAFWAWEKLNPSSKKLKERRSRSAQREIGRFRVAENYNEDKSLVKIKTAVSWRQNEKIDLLRLCFASTIAETSAEDSQNNIIEVEVSGEEYEKIQHFESLILAELRIQKMAVRGYDRQNRAIIIKLSRQGPWPSDRDDAAYGYEIAHCYYAERGIATSEYLTRGQLPEVMVVADFSDYASSNSPPVGVMIAGLLGLQPNYPGRLGKAVLLESPLWLQATANMLKPFLAENTRSRLIVSGGSLDKLASYFYSSKSITDVMHELVDESQAMPFMLPGGKLSSELHPEVQVTTLPFFCLYDG